MKGFLIAEEGPFAGLIIRLDEGDEWIIGRDPDVCYQVIEDPMVSRKHVIIRLEDNESFVAENLSAVNPASINGKHITEQSTLQDGDMLQIGNVLLRFTYNDPMQHVKSEDYGLTEEHSETASIFDEGDRLDAFTFTSDEKARWIVKVTSGPNMGAEFSISKGSTHILGKDPHSSDIVFQDLSVSKQHARFISDENNALTIEDLHSRNGVALNGRLIHEPTLLSSQDSIIIGTTHLLIIDTEAAQDTLVSPPPLAPTEEEQEALVEPIKKDWKSTVIPFRHITVATLFLLLLAVTAGGLISLFSGSEVVVEQKAAPDQLEEKLEKFPSVQYSFASATGKLFLLGNVMTEVDHQELIYLLKTLSFVRSIEDNVVIDELVWENTNAMLLKYPNWRGVFLTSSKPGYFVLKGYVANPEEAANLEAWMNINFSYLDKLSNTVVVEETLLTRIQALLLSEGFATVTFQLTNGDVVLAGRVPTRLESKYMSLTNSLKRIEGVRNVKSYVIFTKKTNEYIDLTSKFTVTGTSKLGNVSQFVVINGKILSQGEDLDGMTITEITQNEVFLEKDGLKYKINYNQQ